MHDGMATIPTRGRIAAAWSLGWRAGASSHGSRAASDARPHCRDLEAGPESRSADAGQRAGGDQENSCWESGGNCEARPDCCGLAAGAGAGAGARMHDGMTTTPTLGRIAAALSRGWRAGASIHGSRAASDARPHCRDLEAGVESHASHQGDNSTGSGQQDDERDPGRRDSASTQGGATGRMNGFRTSTPLLGPHAKASTWGRRAGAPMPGGRRQGGRAAGLRCVDAGLESGSASAMRRGRKSDRRPDGGSLDAG